MLSFPGLQRLHYNKIMYCLNSPDSSSYCNACLHSNQINQIIHYVAKTNDYLSKIELCSYFVIASTVISTILSQYHNNI